MSHYTWTLDIRLARHRDGHSSGDTETSRYTRISTRCEAEQVASAKLVEAGLDADTVNQLIPFATREWANNWHYLDQPQPGNSGDIAGSTATNRNRPALVVGVRIYEDIPRWRIAAGALITAAAPTLSQAIRFCDDFRRFRASHARPSPAAEKLIGTLIGTHVVTTLAETSQLHSLLIDRPDIETAGQLQAFLADPHLPDQYRTPEIDSMRLRLTAVSHQRFQ